MAQTSHLPGALTVRALTAQQAADVLGLSVNHMRVLVCRGRLDLHPLNPGQSPTFYAAGDVDRAARERLPQGPVRRARERFLDEQVTPV